MFTWLYIISIPVILLPLSCKSTINKLSTFIHILAALFKVCFLHEFKYHHQTAATLDSF